MAYKDRIENEIRNILSAYDYGYERLIPKSVTLRIAKLARLHGFACGVSKPEIRTLKRIFSGRPNRTPFKFKFQRY